MQRLTQEELSQLNLLWQKIIVQAWKDAHFKKELLAHPKKMLTQYVQEKGGKIKGQKLPDDFEVRVLEDREDLYHFVILLPNCLALESSYYHPGWNQVLTKVWQDPQLKKELLRDPMSILMRHGISLPPGAKAKIVEDQENVAYFVIPLKPKQELTEADLQSIAGAGEYTDGCF